MRDMTDAAAPTKQVVSRGYAICTSPRSGSNLFCQYLSSTGVLGHPLEYFNAPGRRLLGYPDFPEEPAKQIDWILSAGATPNGIFGLKILPFQFDQIAQSIRWTQLLPNLHYVLLERRDRLGQAISAHRAEQTQQWRASLAAQGVASYDGGKIYERLVALARDYARWTIFFARNGIDPTVIAYEDIVTDPQSAVDRLAGLFGLQGQALVAPDRIDLTIQRDAITAEWRARFCEEYRNADELDALR
jgi:trehalose 2-sulfotransferase